MRCPSTFDPERDGGESGQGSIIIPSLLARPSVGATKVEINHELTARGRFAILLRKNVALSASSASGSIPDL